MKKIFLFSFPLLFALGCYKKQIFPQANALSVIIDGKNVDFKEISIDSTQSYLGITAAVDSTASSPEISITIFKDGPLTVGTYPVLTATSGSSQLNYYERAGGILTEYQSPDDSVNITSISVNSIVGTFHGTGDYAQLDPNSFQVTLDPTRKKILTGGKFNVKLR